MALGRITGKEGALFLALSSTLAVSDKIADLYDWTFEFNQAYESCPIKGEVHDTVAIGGISTRITAARYIETGATPTRLAKFLSANAPASGNSYKGVPVEYRLEQIATGASLNTGAVLGAVITGTGVIVRGSINSPRGMATDSIEIMGTTLPVVT